MTPRDAANEIIQFSDHYDADVYTLAQAYLALEARMEKYKRLEEVARKYDNGLCYCDDDLINTGGGMCTQCLLSQCLRELEE